jgi:hypothetical protein
VDDCLQWIDAMNIAWYLPGVDQQQFGSLLKQGRLSMILQLMNPQRSMQMIAKLHFVEDDEAACQMQPAPHTCSTSSSAGSLVQSCMPLQHGLQRPVL